MNFLFWNINKNKNCFDVIRKMLYSEDIDMLMIAEYPKDIDESQLLSIINTPPATYNYEYIQPIANYGKVKIFTRFSKDLITQVKDDTNVSAIQYFSPLLNNNVTIITCHFPSKVNKSDANLSAFAEDIKDFIEIVETSVGHKRTILCGDLNMNPFDEGIIKTKGLHAVMEKAIARKEQAIVRKRGYSFFYNPMWGFLGDNGCGNTSGTMYYNSSDTVNYYWHLYDQVLVRPPLIDNFDEKQLEIITKVMNTNLLTSNSTINKKYSDHLPIKFNFKI